MKHMIIYSMLSFVGLYSISVVFVINEIHSLRQFDYRRLYIFRKKVKKEIKIKRWRKLQITYEKKITVAWIIKIFLRKNTTFIVFLSVFHIIFTDLNTGLYSVKKVLIKLSCFLSFTFYSNLKIMVSERKGQFSTIAEKSNRQIVLGLFIMSCVLFFIFHDVLELFCFIFMQEYITETNKLTMSRWSVWNIIIKIFYSDELILAF